MDNKTKANKSGMQTGLTASLDIVTKVKIQKRTLTEKRGGENDGAGSWERSNFNLAFGHWQEHHTTGGKDTEDDVGKEEKKRERPSKCLEQK